MITHFNGIYTSYMTYTSCDIYDTYNGGCLCMFRV